jgi:cytochrome c peroxidase
LSKKRHSIGQSFPYLVLAALAAAVTLAGTAQAQHFAVDPTIERLVEPGNVVASDPDDRVVEGFRLFTEETFGGNGRTCASCHPVDNNFTIDPAYIRKLPRRDPLFVAERNRDLRALEVPALMRRRGLILENLDGFEQPGVMRGVPHTLGLGLSIRNTSPDFPLPGHEALGWSGDGAPGDGTLREFAIGAVTQHFPRTLERRACSLTAFEADPDACDFRLPTEAELDALLAFQLFTGRHEEVNIDTGDANALSFSDPFVEQGRVLFDRAPSVKGSRSCAFCHRNAGANDRNGDNLQFATGVRKHPNAPACKRPGMPGDGGFGPEPVVDETISCAHGRSVVATFRGNGFFNTPSLIEAGDTPPYFHNNAVDTIEEAVAFYTTDAFNDSLSGDGNAFVLSREQIRQIAALLRTLNVLENIRSGNAYDQLALRMVERRPAAARRFVKLAIKETTDAIQVLNRGPVALFENSNVHRLLRRARNLEKRAIRRRKPNLLRLAIAAKNRARDQMTVAPEELPE